MKSQYLIQSSRLIATAIATCLISVHLAVPAQAYRLFFGEDLNNSELIPLPSTPNANAAEVSFLSNLIGVGTETFETFAPGTTSPIELVFPGAGTATLNGTGQIVSVPPGQTNGSGRYPISGQNFWEADANGGFSINFSDPVAAFGFYGIDIGDFGGQLTLTLTGGTQTTVTVPNTSGSWASTGGSVFYLGLIAESLDELFNNISFHMTTGQGDIFAFDNMTVGSLEQVQPAPEFSSVFSLLLFGIAGLTLTWKRQQTET